MNWYAFFVTLIGVPIVGLMVIGFMWLLVLLAEYSVWALVAGLVVLASFVAGFALKEIV